MRNKSPPSLETPKQLSILLAEDEAINRFALEKQLRNVGHSVVAVGNGSESIEELSKKHFDVVLMDIQMPVMDGVEATRSIRNGVAGKEVADIPIIALTAYVLPKDKNEFQKTGMNGYVSKPVDFDTLTEALHAVFRDNNQPMERSEND